MPKQTIWHGVKFTISLLVLAVFVVVIVDANKLSKTGNTIYVSPMFVQQTSLEEGYIAVSNVSIELDENNRGILKYVVQAGDSLYGIASKFGTTVSRIKKVNNIRGPIRPNDVLTISEDDGLLYTMKSTMNVKLFAEKYDLNLQDLMTLNGIADESELMYRDTELFLNITKEKSYDVGLFPRPKPVIIPPKRYKKPVITRVAPKPRYVPSSNTNSRTPRVTSGTRGKRGILAKRTYNKKKTNGFYAGHCTWYMAATTPSIFTCQNADCSVQKRPFRGNAKDWYDNAAAAGYRVGSVPAPGAIVVYSRTVGRYAALGHVAKVINYDPKTNTMLIEDMNALGKYIVTRRYVSSVSPKIRGYIYP
ncbi:MAG: hypothetical protein CR971_01395 [candidate division SR1 bacterium]|nr:MAG: hypothetical protein CR971_01395 [candidate division SR1 bacterium]